MLGGMTTRSRRRGATKHEAAKKAGIGLADGHDGKFAQDTVTKDNPNPTSVEEFEKFEPLKTFTIDPTNSITEYVNVPLRRPALISPAPEDCDGSAKSCVSEEKSDGPVIPDAEDLRINTSSRHSSKRPACMTTSLPPFKKRKQAKDEEFELAPDAIRGYLEEKGIQVDERLCEAASTLIQLRYTSVPECRDDLSLTTLPITITNSDPSKEQDCSSNPTHTTSERTAEGLRLAQPEDAQELNSLHCFVRSDLLELFTLPGSDDEIIPPHSRSETSSTQNPGAPVYTGRVGLRCLHCSHLPRVERTGCTMSTFYPKSLDDLYRTVCTWQRVHFRACRHIPDDVKETYWRLKETDRTRGKTKYWVTSARRMGLVDVNDARGGVRFA